MATTAKRRRRRNLPGDVEDQIRHFALIEWSPKQIHEKVTRKIAPEDQPSLRTVQRIVAEMTPSSADTPWEFTEATGEDGTLVMGVLNDLVRQGGHWTRSVSRAEVRWIVLIRRAAPDLPASDTWTLAKLLVLTENPKPPPFLGDDWVTSVNFFLIYAPWRSAVARAAYARAAESGWIPCSQWIGLHREGNIELIAPTAQRSGTPVLPKVVIG